MNLAKLFVPTLISTSLAFSQPTLANKKDRENTIGTNGIVLEFETGLRETIETMGLRFEVKDGKIIMHTTNSSGIPKTEVLDRISRAPNEKDKLRIVRTDGEILLCRYKENLTEGENILHDVHILKPDSKTSFKEISLTTHFIKNVC